LLELSDTEEVPMYLMENMWSV